MHVPHAQVLDLPASAEVHREATLAGLVEHFEVEADVLRQRHDIRQQHGHVQRATLFLRSIRIDDLGQHIGPDRATQQKRIVATNTAQLRERMRRGPERDRVVDLDQQSRDLRHRVVIATRTFAHHALAQQLEVQVGPALSIERSLRAQRRSGETQRGESTDE